MNMQEMLATRDAHEELTTEGCRISEGRQAFDTFTLSTESCDICEEPVPIYTGRTVQTSGADASLPGKPWCCGK